MRAATYEKLEQLQNALRDAKAMIDLKPEMAKGYLRCAKVLQLKGEKELALKIYERGLAKVKIGTDDNRTVCSLCKFPIQVPFADNRRLSKQCLIGCDMPWTLARHGTH
jgi:tetratricopeptide (TPR) repeat protein